MTGTGINYAASRVILLGTSRYDDREITDVPAVENSLRGMYSVLTDRRLGGWPPDRVEYWLNRRETGAVTIQLRELAETAEAVLIFYFAGHGMITGDGELCLILSDSNHDHPDATGLELERVKRALRDSTARTKIVILDCCYSGRATRQLSGGEVPQLAHTPGAYTLTASNMRDEMARWSRKNEPTAFTRELLRVIHSGRPDKPEILTLHDLYEPLSRELTRRGLPRASATGRDMGGYLPFTLNVAFGAASSPGDAPPPPVLPPRAALRRPPWSRGRHLTRREALIAGGATVLGGAAAAGAYALWPQATGSGSAPIAGVDLGNAGDSHTQAWVVAAGQLNGKPVAISGGKEGNIIVWDLTTKTPMMAPITNGAGVSGLAVTTVSNTPVIISGDVGNAVKVWDLETGHQLAPHLPILHTQRVWRVAVAVVDGQHVAISGSDDGTTWLWNLESHRPIGTLKNYGAKVFSVATSTLSHVPVAITGASDNSVRLWDLRTRQARGQPMYGDDPYPIQSVAISTLNNRPIAVSGDTFAYVRRWNLDTDQEDHAALGRFPVPQNWVWDVAIGQLRGQAIAIAVGGNFGMIWNLSKGGNLEATLAGQADSVWAVALTEFNGRTHAVTGCINGRVRLFDLGATGP